MSVKCYNCQGNLEISNGSDLGRAEECPSCRAVLRCCRMCVFYDKSSYNECKEPTADRILDKEKANFCDHYKVGQGQNAQSEKVDILAQANALFKK
ncbi:MAG: hypothetical protein KC478_05505 [Bacteriovoracaceae bacterium]|nr:hypothetical protein [Bacteriovoracaceae bacterium]